MQFTKQVCLYKRNESGDLELDTEKKPIPERELGTFIFKKPTIRDEAEMRVARKKLLSGVKFDELDDFDKLYIEFNVYFPRLVISAPERWNWDYLDAPIILALMNAFLEGLGGIED